MGADHILSRFKSVDEGSYSMCDYIVRKLGIPFKDSQTNDLYLNHTLSSQRKGMVKTLISIQSPEFHICSEDETPLDF
ncbi:MAG: hypothetical protein ACRC9L_07485 [Brevinema sp.]